MKIEIIILDGGCDRMLNECGRCGSRVHHDGYMSMHVIRNFVMIYKTARTINKGSRVINIENSDNGQMNDFYATAVLATLILLLFCLLFVSPPCVPLSINERNLIIHCSV